MQWYGHVRWKGQQEPTQQVVSMTAKDREEDRLRVTDMRANGMEGKSAQVPGKWRRVIKQITC